MLIIAFNIQAQQVTLKVISVKGKVSYKNNFLKKDDVIKIESLELSTLKQQLKFSTANDFVKILDEKKNLKVFAPQCPATDKLSGLYTRGPTSKMLLYPIEFNHYFGAKKEQKNMWLWQDDTLIAKKSSCGISFNNKDTLLVASFIYAGENNEIRLNRHDTIILSKKNLFYRKVKGTYKWINSFEVDSFNLSIINPGKNEQYVVASTPDFYTNIYFIDDYVHYLKELGLVETEIINSLGDVCSIEDMAAHFSCKTEEVNTYLKRYIDALAKR